MFLPFWAILSGKTSPTHGRSSLSAFLSFEAYTSTFYLFVLLTSTEDSNKQINLESLPKNIRTLNCMADLVPPSFVSQKITLEIKNYLLVLILKFSAHFPFQINQNITILQLILLSNLFPLSHKPILNPALMIPINYNQTFQTFVGNLANQKKYKSFLKKGIEEYDILKYKVSNLTAFDIKKMYYKIVTKYSQQSTSSQSQKQNQQNGWLINELKIFVWVTVCYAFQQDQHLSTLNSEGWKFFISVFYFKPLEILQYQLLSLLKGDSLFQDRKWTHAQNQLLKCILMDPQLQNKWNQISKLFFLRSSKKYFRKPQKCREHWYNHLNPLISHQPWTLEEDLLMVDYVNKIGKKWSQVSILMGGHRTEHMVKNRFKSLEKKFQKEIMQSENKQIQPQMLMKKENQKWQAVKPSILKIESTQTAIEQKTQQPLVCIQPANIKPILMEQENFKNRFSTLTGEEAQQNLIEVTEEKFFVKTKRSIDLMSEIDDEIGKYVESFLF